MNTKITQNIKAVILGLILTIGIGYSIAAWTEPGCAPTGCNVPAPINVGGDAVDPANAQQKTGILKLDNLIAGKFTFIGGPTGSPTAPVAGRVLTADDTTGKASWKDSSSNIKSVQAYVTTTPNITITIPTGTTKLIISATASMSCDLPNADGRGIQMVFSGSTDGGTTYADYATLLVSSGDADNDPGHLGISASTNGVLDIPSGVTSVNLKAIKNVYDGNNISLDPLREWSQVTNCGGVPLIQTFKNYIVTAI